MAIKTIIERSVSGQNDWTVLTNDADFPVSFVDDTAVEDVTYDYRARLQDGDNLSPYSSIRTIKTLSSVTAPDAPTSLIATAMSKNQINLTWVAPTNTGGSPIIGYKIERRVGSSGSWGTLVANTASTSTAWNDGGLNPSTQYQYRVYALNSIGQSVASTVSSATTHQDATAPNPPIGLAAEAISHNKINLTWITPSDGGSAITGYMIERRLGAGPWTVIVHSTSSAATTYLSEGLASNTEYSFRVSAINAIGTSSPSVAATATTYVTPSPITISEVTTDSALVSWTNFAPTARGFVVVLNGTPLEEVEALFYQLEDLFSDYSYTVRIRAIANNGSILTQTEVITFTTEAEVVIDPEAPINVSIDFITDNSAVVSWEAPDAGELGFNVYLGGVKRNETLIEDETFDLISLSPGSTYNVIVSAVYSDHEAYAQVVQFSTTGEAIGLPRNFQEVYTVTGGGLYNGEDILVDIYVPQWLRDNPSWVGDAPYILWTHGAGEFGFDIGVLRSAAGYPRFINLGDDFPYVIISPQARGQNWSIEFLDKVLNFVKGFIPQINLNKIGVAGWSGGVAPYLYLNEAPERVVVSIPFSVVSGVASENRCNSIAYGASVWPVVAQTDPYGAGGHVAYYGALKSCPHYDPIKHRMTLYSTGGHDCVTRSIRQNASGGEVEPGYNSIEGSTLHDWIMDRFDFEAPSVPENLAVVSKSSNSITIGWDASTDGGSGVRGYIVAIDDVEQVMTMNTEFTVFDLDPETEYSLKVKAVDNNGNESAYSSTLNVTTEAEPSYTLEETYKASFHGNASAVSAGWTLMEGSGVANASYSRNINNEGATKTITISSQKAWWQAVAAEPSTGDESGIYIDIVLRTAWRARDSDINASGNKCFKISGLDPTRRYDFDILCNASGADINNRLIVTDALGDQTIDRLISNQTLTDETCLVKFTKKTPNASGEIELDLKILGPTQLIYINAIVTREYSL